FSIPNILLPPPNRSNDQGHREIFYRLEGGTRPPELPERTASEFPERAAVGRVLQANSPPKLRLQVNPAGNSICTQHAAKSLRKVQEASDGRGCTWRSISETFPERLDTSRS